jgi:threonine/homoserine/homoserine lactone efflux protein
MGGDLLQDSPKRPSVHGGYLTGLLMTLSNPMTLIFWFAVVPAQMGQITDKPAHDLPAVCVGVFLATLGWVIAFAGAVSVAGRFRRNWWLVVADAAGGAALVALAIITAFAFAASPSIMAAHH